MKHIDPPDLGPLFKPPPTPVAAVMPPKPKVEHDRHAMHANSKKAWRMVDMGRAKEVLTVLREAGRSLTDREICNALGRADMNYVRPCITKLIDETVLVEVDSVHDGLTGRRVRRVWFSEPRANEPRA